MEAGTYVVEEQQPALGGDDVAHGGGAVARGARQRRQHARGGRRQRHVQHVARLQQHVRAAPRRRLRPREPPLRAVSAGRFLEQSHYCTKI